MKIYAKIFLFLLIISCKNKELPADLKQERAQINKKLDSLDAIVNKKKVFNNAKNLITEYQLLKKSLIDYNKESTERGFPKNNQAVLRHIDYKITFIKNNQPIDYITAKEFMQKRCISINQTLVSSKIVKIKNVKLYMFMSIAKNGYICISMVAENSLKIISSDCGPQYQKLQQWKKIPAIKPSKSINDKNKALTKEDYVNEFMKNKIEAFSKNDKKILHEDLRNFKDFILMMYTEKYMIRIDELNNDQFRYASWSKNKKMDDRPDLTIRNGNLIPLGSGGNHKYVFINDQYKYECLINRVGSKNTPPANLVILKNNTEILNSPAKILKE